MTTAHVPRKRFGQHFLHDAGILRKIVQAIAPQRGDNLVEIGPGEGALTLPLLREAGHLTAIELDRDLVPRLRASAEGVGELEIVNADVLTVDFATLAKKGPLRVVGNLPYNISTPILFHLLDAVDHVVDQHFMLQKEVVDRMAGSPGGKDYGRLSVMLQWRYAIASVLEVPPEAFDPPPRVDSAVVRMIPRTPEAGVDGTLLRELVTSAFSQRRKLLRHTLGRWLEERKFSGAFDVQRRAEEVPVDEYLALARAVGRP
jgi:16S rRNA (adenine1518-N6/adenine1519-N6)-dimethyltransferase